MSGRFTSFGFSRYSSRLRDSDRHDPCNDCSCLNPDYPFYQDFTKALFSLYFEDFTFYAYEGVDSSAIRMSSSFDDVWAFITSQDGVKYGSSLWGDARDSDNDPVVDQDINNDFLSADGSTVYRIDPSGRTYSVPENENDPADPIDTSDNPGGEFVSFVWPFPAATVRIWHDHDQTFALWVNDSLQIMRGNGSETSRTITIPEGAQVTWGWMSTAESSDYGDVTFGFGFLRSEDAGDQHVYDIDMKLLF